MLFRSEIHALIARNLAPDDAINRLRLGLLLESAYGGRHDVEAAVELREASALRPESSELLYRLGTVEQRLGNWEAATAAYEGVLKSGGEGAEDARQRLDALRRAPPPIAPSAENQSHLPPDAAKHYRIALELFRRGRSDEARTELDTAIALAPDASELLNRKARLLLQSGQEAEAEATWEHSLAATPGQGTVLLLLGELATSRGDSAEAEQIGRAHV